MEIKVKQKRSYKTGINNGFIENKLDGRTRDVNNNLCPPAVDMVVKCIRHYRKQSEMQARLHIPITQAIKTIYLCERLWNQFEYWYRSVCLENESEANVKMLTCFGVEIKRMTSFRKPGNGNDGMDWDYYPIEIAKA